MSGVFRCPGNTSARATRARADGRPARRHRPRDGALAGHCRAAARRRSRHGRFARGAGPAAGAAQAAAGTPATQSRRRRRAPGRSRPSAARPSAGAKRYACSPRPARSMNRKARAPTTGASPARCTRRVSAPASWPTTAFLSLHAGRLHDGNRRARRGLHRLSRRHRPDRAAGARHRRPGAQRLYRHAQLPEDHSGKSRRTRRAAGLAAARALVSGEAFPPRCATGWPRAASRATRPMAAPTWA